MPRRKTPWPAAGMTPAPSSTSSRAAPDAVTPEPACTNMRPQVDPVLCRARSLVARLFDTFRHFAKVAAPVGTSARSGLAAVTCSRPGL